MKITEGAIAFATLNAMCVSVETLFPGYFPSVFRGERSKKTAPHALAAARARVFFPVPGAPNNATALDVRGQVAVQIRRRPEG